MCGEEWIEMEIVKDLIYIGSISVAALLIAIVFLLISLKLGVYCRAYWIRTPSSTSFHNPIYEEFQSSPRRMSEELTVDSRPKSLPAPIKPVDNFHRVTKALYKSQFEILITDN